MADLRISKSATGAFVANENATYTIEVTNAGPAAATGVTVTDTLPAGAAFVSATPSQGTCNAASPVICDLGAFGDGASATITLVVRPSAAGPLTNTATVSGGEDSNAANDSSTAVVEVGANADLSIVKSAAGTFVAGRNASYSIVVTNNGPSPAAGVVVTDTLPAGLTFISATTTRGTCNAASPLTCNVGTLSDGATATITLVVQPAASGALSNTAQVDSSSTDAVAANDSSTVVVIVAPADTVAVPALDTRALLLLAALLAMAGICVAGKLS